MSDESQLTPGANNATDEPVAKKARTDDARNPPPNPPGSDAAARRNAAQDGARKGSLLLSITDWEAFKQSTDKVLSDPIVLAGIQWQVDASVRGQSVCVWLRAAHPDNKPQWYCKAEMTLRWRRRPRSERLKGISVFSPTSTTLGWAQLETLDVSDVQRPTRPKAGAEKIGLHSAYLRLSPQLAMSDQAPAMPSANNATDEPVAKKARIDEAGSSPSSPPAKDVAAPPNATLDGARKGTLVLIIADWEAFKQSTEKVRSKPVVLAGVQWRVEAFVQGQGMSVWLCAAHPANQPQWYCKAEMALRWPRRPRFERVKGITVFDETSTTFGWAQLDTLDRISQFHVQKNALKLTIDVTTFSCHVTDGIYGHQSRCHDVAFVFGNRRIYSNKAFLAMNSEFFEAKFFGAFADRNQDEVDYTGKRAAHFAAFLQAIAPAALPITAENVVALLVLADRFQAHKLVEACLDFCLTCHQASFGKTLRLTEWLNMDTFRDLLIETATPGELSEAAKEKYEFTDQTWKQLLLKYVDLQPPRARAFRLLRHGRAPMPNQDTHIASLAFALYQATCVCSYYL